MADFERPRIWPLQLEPLSRRIYGHQNSWLHFALALHRKSSFREGNPESGADKSRAINQPICAIISCANRPAADHRVQHGQCAPEDLGELAWAAQMLPGSLHSLTTARSAVPVSPEVETARVDVTFTPNRRVAPVGHSDHPGQTLSMLAVYNE
jgi:hypothetical protein